MPHGLALSFGDVLLIGILGFGTARLLSLIVAPILLAPDLGVGRVTLVLVFLAFHSTALLGAVYLIAVRWRGLDWPDLGLSPTSGQWILRAIVVAVMAYPVTVILKFATQLLFGLSDKNPQLDLIAPDSASFGSMLGMLVMVAVLAPLTEELVFRGILYRWLRNRWGVAASAVVSALCFAALHGILVLIPALTLLGVVLAWLTERSGSLWPAIVTHGLFNAITIVLLYSAKAAGIDLT